VVSITRWPFYPQEAPQYPLNRRLVGPESCSKHFGVEKNLLLLPGIKEKNKIQAKLAAGTVTMQGVI
jgi:hypothetical protein